MSNPFAIPTVTASLVALLQSRIDLAGITPSPVVAPGRLDDEDPAVVVHLYRVSRNPSLSTADLPTRSSTGTLRTKPRAALDLHYLLAFRGTDPYESERLLGIAAATLHTTPALSDAIVGYATAHYPVSGNDLADADEPVRLCADMLDVDDLTRLWSLYGVSTFVVTLAVQAGPVLVELDDVPGTVLPVRAFGAGVRVVAPPRIDAVAGPEGIGTPVRAAAPMPVLDVVGAALSVRAGETLEVLVDGAAVPSVTAVDDTHLRLPAPSLPGAHSIQVRRTQQPLGATASTTRPSVASEVAAFAVVPSLLSVSATTAPDPPPAVGTSSGTVDASIEPAVDQTMRVRLLLDSIALDPPVALALPVSLSSSATTSISAPVDEAPVGAYRVTVEVNGMRSLPQLGAGGLYTLTTVTL